MSIFQNGIGYFWENHRSFVTLNTGFLPGTLSITGVWLNGLIHMPDFAGYNYATIQEVAQANEEGRLPQPILRSEIDKTLALSMYRISGDYSFGVPLSSRVALNARVKEDLFARVAYNFYDLAPMIDYVQNGPGIVDAFSEYYTGGSFFRLKATSSISLGMSIDNTRLISTFWNITSTDLLFTDQSVGFRYSWKNRFSLLAAYDFSSYALYNGQTTDSFTLQANLNLGEVANVMTAAEYHPNGSNLENTIVRLSVSIPYPAGGNPTQPAFGNMLRDPTPTAEAPQPPAEMTRMVMPEVYIAAIDQDIHSVLSVTDRSFRDVVGILYTYRSDLMKYDSARAVDPFAPERLSGRSPAEYLNYGGACIDFSKFIATVLQNNSFESRVVIAGLLSGSPHAFVVARDHSGAYYTLDGFSKTNRIVSATSFESAAAAYAHSFTQLVVRNVNGKIDSVTEIPEMEFLDRLMSN